MQQQDSCQSAMLIAYIFIAYSAIDCPHSKRLTAFLFALVFRYQLPPFWGNFDLAWILHLAQVLLCNLRIPFSSPSSPLKNTGGGCLVWKSSSEGNQTEFFVMISIARHYTFRIKCIPKAGQMTSLEWCSPCWLGLLSRAPAARPCLASPYRLLLKSNL